MHSVRTTYSSTPDSNRGLRDIVMNTFWTYWWIDLMEIPGAEEKLATIDEFSIICSSIGQTRSRAPSVKEAGVCDGSVCLSPHYAWMN
ncbi:hypothetical protein K458DRAFT_422442 [Lentithecium fluviatile CBS 122367]|uniref:Uncharacterized protein n=1 Tax=Lentithecium fluviatile CBS 122367 TaxID=1168545 RepID=A0A6G1IMJ1_9PLEO|nr:hypothetical protein K458DRAFT_422442 [Lentithecium fluviatile CBS 122367]